MERVNGGDLGGVQSHHRSRCVSVHRRQPGDLPALEPQPDLQRVLRAIVKPERPPMNPKRRPLRVVGARLGRVRHAPVTGHPQFPLQGLRGQFQAFVKAQGARENAAGQVPLATLEFAGDQMIEPHQPRHEQAGKQTDPEQQQAWPAPRLRLAPPAGRLPAAGGGLFSAAHSC